MKHGEIVTASEREFAQYVGARYAIAMTNGTVTLEVALRALGIGAGDRVATTPLTMAATSIAILNVGAVPVYCDVDPRTWLMAETAPAGAYHLPVSLYGLNYPRSPSVARITVDDAAQTLRRIPERLGAAFTSYSTQSSKIVSTGEGGVLCTNSEELATLARSIGSLGYDLSPKQSRIDSAAIKASDAVRHVRYPAINARMNDATAQLGLAQLEIADRLKDARRSAAAFYRNAIACCSWITPQHVPDGWTHDYWCYAIACDSEDQAWDLQEAVERNGGERPYAAWRLTYREPAFRRLVGGCDQCGSRTIDMHTNKCFHCEGMMRSLTPCPVAESLQPRLLQFQTNDVASAAANALALHAAIRELNG